MPKKLHVISLFLVLLLAISGCTTLFLGYDLGGRVQTKHQWALKGLTIQIVSDEGTKTVLTDDGGSWFDFGYRGKVTVTPVLEGVTFIPAKQEVSSTNLKVDFEAVVPTLDYEIKLDVRPAPETEPGTYQAVCTINPFTQDVEADFSDSVVTLDGVQLAYADEMFTATLNGVNAGDSLAFSVEHELFTYTDAFVVPEQLDEVTLDGDLTKWLSGEVEEIALLLPEEDSCYEVTVTSYDATKQMFENGENVIDGYSVHGKMILREQYLQLGPDDERPTYGKITILPVFSGYPWRLAPTSELKVTAQAASEISNLQ